MGLHMFTYKRNKTIFIAYPWAKTFYGGKKKLETYKYTHTHTFKNDREVNEVKTNDISFSLHSKESLDLFF